MKRYLILFSATLAFTGIISCTDDAGKNTSEKKDSTKLSTDLVNNPRSADGTDPVAVENMATLDFKDTLHNFGTITEGEIVTYDFEFTNNGKSPLLITSATATCGCTVPSYNKEPIPPGKKEVMTVRFNSAGKTGTQEKHIVIKTNSQRGEHYLIIRAEVAEVKGKNVNKLQ